MANQTDKEQIQELKKIWKNYGIPIALAVIVGLGLGYGWRWYKNNKTEKNDMMIQQYSQVVGEFEAAFLDSDQSLSNAKAHEKKAQTETGAKKKSDEAQAKVYTAEAERYKQDAPKAAALFLQEAQSFLKAHSDTDNADMVRFYLAKYDMLKDKKDGVQKALQQLAKVYQREGVNENIKTIAQLRASKMLIDLKQYDKATALLAKIDNAGAGFKQLKKAYKMEIALMAEAQKNKKANKKT
jgi:predicted negative regulator of RcsB-dependent stress response